MLPSDLTYLFPNAALLFLLVLPFILLWIAYLHYRHKQLTAYTSPALLDRLAILRSPFLMKIKVLLLGLSFMFAVAALMGPIGHLHYRQDPALSSPSSKTQDSALPQRQTHDVIFLVDTSASMGVQDATAGRSRLDEAKIIIDEIISQLKGDNVALAAFTSTLTPLVPSTMDYLFTRLILKNVQINEGAIGGTDLTKTLQKLQQDYLLPTNHKYYTVILVSDGGDNKIEKLEGLARQTAIKELLTVIPNPQELNLRLFTIGVGSSKGGIVPRVLSQGHSVESTLEPEILQQLASAERGLYYEASRTSTWTLIQNLLEKIKQDPLYRDKNSAESTMTRTIITAQDSELLYTSYFQLPLGLSLLCLLFFFLIPDVVSKQTAEELEK